MTDIRSKFIVSEEFSKDNVSALAERVLKFGKVTKAGTIILGEHKLSRGDVVKLALVIRYIGNSFDDSIPATLRPADLSQIIPERLESIGSRLSKLSKDGFVKKVGYGQYAVHPYKIEAFISGLETGPKSENDDPFAAFFQKEGRRQKELTGIGLDVQKLIDSGFFETPRVIKEVDAELRKETRYHDPKVLDMTIRKTFVGNRRSLKRIPNTEGGQARWRYVVRK